MSELIGEWLPFITFAGSILGGYIGVRVETAVLKSRVVTLEHATRRAHERIDKVFDERHAPR